MSATGQRLADRDRAEISQALGDWAACLGHMLHAVHRSNWPRALAWSGMCDHAIGRAAYLARFRGLT